MKELTIQLDEAIEKKASRVLTDLNISKDEAVRMLFEYIAKHQRVPEASMMNDNNQIHLTDLLMQMPNVGEDEDFAF